MQDANLVLRDGSTDLTAAEAEALFTAKKLGSTLPRTPMFLMISKPTDPGDADETATFSLRGCHTSGGSYVALVTTPALHANGVYFYAFTSDFEYYKLDIAVAGTTINHGKVVVEITPYARMPHDMPNR